MPANMKKAGIKYKVGGSVLKDVDKSKNPGLGKLPTEVRNKMGYKKNGGSVKVMAKSVMKYDGSIKAKKKK